MLDSAIVTELQGVFSRLAQPVSLVVRPVIGDADGKHAELLQLARAVAATSDKLDVRVEGAPARHVELALHAGATATGVTFRAVPGGHEFTSLVLAVLHAGGVGRLPDQATTERIRRLVGPAKLRTYVSLDCTNCPDVVQAINLITILHPDIEHETIDGALFPEEVAKLGIAGVPAVFLGETLIHSGRGGLAELIDVLERRLGTAPLSGSFEKAAPQPPAEYDVVVIGGGPAGASAAIYSARKGLRTAMIAEKVGGQLTETVGIENMIGTKQTEGRRLAADLESHVRSYAVDVLEHRRVVSVTNGERREVTLSSGERVRGETLIVATGAKWRELGVPGEKQYLGRGVAFCPHCDGPFYKGRRVAVVGGGNSGVEAAIDLSGIVSHVTVVEYAESLKADDVLIRTLRSRANVSVITGAKTVSIDGDGAKVTSLTYLDTRDGGTKTLALDGVFVQIGLVPNSAIVKDLVLINRFGEIVVDERGRTSAPGIYAAGDVTTAPWKQIVIAMGDGAKVALSAFEERTLRSA